MTDEDSHIPFSKEHAYDVPGTYTATITVQNSTGLKTAATKTLIVTRD